MAISIYWFLFFVHVCCPAAALHSAAGGMELGESLGAQVLAADDEIAADAGQNGGKSSFQNAYAEELTSNEMVLVNPAVSKVLEQSNRLAQNLVEKDGARGAGMLTALMVGLRPAMASVRRQHRMEAHVRKFRSSTACPPPKSSK